MRHFIGILVGTALLLGCGHPQPSPNDPPNIILCMADDQGWGDMGYRGHPHLLTPNFDAMAAEAVRFDRFYAAAPVCSPTRGSVMTGRHPNRFGCFTWGRTLRPQEITIAERLKEAGYVTGHFGKWHLGSVRMGSPVNPGNSGFDEWFSAPNFFDNDAILSREGVAVKNKGESSMLTMDAALEFIQKHEKGEKPYFAVIWFGSPHLPHRAAEEDRSLYQDLSPELQNFYGEITGMDRAMGKLHILLKSIESYENTILWYCSDNGGLPQGGSTGGRGHKGHIYEGGLRVPAIIQWPAMFHKPQVVKVPVNTSDIFPTILEMAGIENINDRPMDGISLLPLLNGEIHERDQPMGFWSYPAAGIRTPSAQWMPELFEAQKQGNMVGDSARLRIEDIKIVPYPMDSLPGHAAWLDWPWKLHRIQNETGLTTWELFDLEKDSMEQFNLVNMQTEKAASMKIMLEQWQHSVLNSLNGGDY